MKILLLGATGRTGKLVLRKALDSGHQVNCLARNTHRIPHEDNLEVFEGTPNDKEDLAKALSGCDTIINVLNISRTSDFPWSSLRTPKTFLSDAMKLILELAEKENLKRIVICSAWGVSETRRHIPAWFKWFIDHSNIGAAYEDHERQEKLLEASNLNWTIIRPVGLTNSSRKEEIRETFDNSPKPNVLISRRSVAQFLLSTLEREDLIHKKVVISKN